MVSHFFNFDNSQQPANLLNECKVHEHTHCAVIKSCVISGTCFLQKPLMLQGHERAITQIKYNREGDLLFSAAKDSKPNVWWSLNGERLGTFNGHGGVVWCLDVDWQSIHLITGGGDSSCR